MKQPRTTTSRRCIRPMFCMVQLYMNSTTFPPFQEWIDALRKKYGTANLTETVMAAVKAEYERMCRDG